MKPSILTMAAACAAAAAAHAQGIDMVVENGPMPADHPTRLVGYYDDKPSTIVDVRSNQGVVLRDGKKRTLSRDTSYGAFRAMAFAPGSVEIVEEEEVSEKTSLVYHFSSGQEVGGGVIRADSHFRGTLKATHDIPDCYMVILFFNEDYLAGKIDAPGLVLAMDNVGTVKAGEPKKVELRYGYLSESKQRKVFLPMVFTKGSEVRSNYSVTEALLFRQVELRQHDRVLAAYREKHPSDDTDPVPELRFAPSFPEGTRLDGLPGTPRVDYTITEDGLVENVTVQEGLPSEVARTLKRTFEGWLYMPKLVHGIPRRTFQAVRIPLQATPAPAAH